MTRQRSLGTKYKQRKQCRQFPDSISAVYGCESNVVSVMWQAPPMLHTEPNFWCQHALGDKRWTTWRRKRSTCKCADTETLHRLTDRHIPSLMAPIWGKRKRVCWMTWESELVMHQCKSSLEDVRNWWSGLVACAPLSMQKSAFVFHLPIIFCFVTLHHFKAIHLPRLRYGNSMLITFFVITNFQARTAGWQPHQITPHIWSMADDQGDLVGMCITFTTTCNAISTV